MGNAVPNINVSNGTCYFAENTETKGNFIPCGNAAHGHWPCCHAGDFCLGLNDANACYNTETGNTYMAGCTDPGFNSRACPKKLPEFHEQEWVAIQHCPEVRSDNLTKWGGCKIDENSTELTKLSHASCDPYCSSPIYIGPSAIPNFATLPNRTGELIRWEAGFDPTASPTTSTRWPKPPTATASSSLSTSLAATSAPVSGEGSGLSTGAKAGIGVGAVGAVLLLVAVVLLALLVRRRRVSKQAAEQSHNQDVMGPEQSRYYSESQKQHWMVQSPDASPYVAYKAELPAEERRAYQAELPAEERWAYQAELPADQNIMPGGGSDVFVVVDRLSPHASPNPSSLTAYSPHLSYSGASPSPAASQTQVSPQITGERNGHEDRPRLNPGSMSRASSELHG